MSLDLLHVCFVMIFIYDSQSADLVEGFLLQMHKIYKKKLIMYFQVFSFRTKQKKKQNFKLVIFIEFRALLVY